MPEWQCGPAPRNLERCANCSAHRAGHVVLANADLKDSKNIKDLQDSAVVFKNAVFHFIRVDA